MIEKDVESENDWLLDIPLLKRNSSVNFIHWFYYLLFQY
jgi:hypothetical protein